MRERLGRWPGVVLAVAGGIVLDLAFPGVGWWWSAPIAVAMLVIALDGRGLRWGVSLCSCQAVRGSGGR